MPNQVESGNVVHDASNANTDRLQVRLSSLRSERCPLRGKDVEMRKEKMKRKTGCEL